MLVFRVARECPTHAVRMIALVNVCSVCSIACVRCTCVYIRVYSHTCTTYIVRRTMSCAYVVMDVCVCMLTGVYRCVCSTYINCTRRIYIYTYITLQCTLCTFYNVHYIYIRTLCVMYKYNVRYVYVQYT